MKRQKKKILNMFMALFFSTLFCLVAGSGLLYKAEGILEDSFYQEESAENIAISIIQIDERSLDEIGPWPWPRGVMAELLERLNSGGEGRKPAAIGIDVLYIDEGDDVEDDLRLAQAVYDCGNVVCAGFADYSENKMEFDGETFYRAQRRANYWRNPFMELSSAAAAIGHINTMEDEDAILRHAMLYVVDPEGSRIPSFSRAVYEICCKSEDRKPVPAPSINNGIFYIPFSKKAGGDHWESISAVDVIRGDVDPEFFAEKVVLIGPYAAELEDEYRTSIDHSRPMYGVEVNANLIAAYENGFFPKEAKKMPQILLLFLISAVSFFFLYEQRLPIAAGGTFLLCAIWLCGCRIIYHQFGILLKLVWVPMAVMLIFVISIAMNYVQTRRERNRVTRTFGNYVDPAVMRQLLEQGSDALELGGKTFDIAVLFVDVRGFSTMSESLDPPTVVEIINKYLTLTTECIMRHHGTLDKFIGDCAMAFWNAPVEQEDPVYLACCAAMDMVEGAEGLGKELMQRFGRTVSFGVGVNWGPAVVGNIGAPRRMDYTAIGDTVNTAARLESNAPGGKILISRSVADALGERASVTSLGSSIKLKGKAEGFEVLTLDALERK